MITLILKGDYTDLKFDYTDIKEALAFAGASLFYKGLAQRKFANFTHFEGPMPRKGCHAEALEACGQRPLHHA